MPAELICAALAFVLAHRLISGSGLRDRMVRYSGERRFQVGFSILSIGLTTWLTKAYLAVATRVATPTSGASVVTLLLAALGCYFVVAGLTTRNPTITGLGAITRERNVVHGVIRLTRHPFLIGILFLSGAHLIVLHGLADWLFFGSLSLVALTGMWSIDRKRARAFGADWQTFRAATSVLPFAAMIAGKQRLRWSDIGWLRPAFAIVAFAIGLHLHR
jgi:uncharacterized membrane protein